MKRVIIVGTLAGLVAGVCIGLSMAALTELVDRAHKDTPMAPSDDPWIVRPNSAMIRPINAPVRGRWDR